MRTFLGQARALLLGSAALVVSSSAFAQTTRYELDAAAPLIADGWSLIEQASTSSFSDSTLRLQTNKGFAEWMLRSQVGESPPTSGWLATADPGRGWWVEVRVSVGAATQCFGGGPGLWVDDGKNFVRLLFAETKVYLAATQLHQFPVDPSRAFHVYRLQTFGRRHFQLLIDGSVVFDDPALQTLGTGKSLMFGDLGGCEASDASWDYVAYDTAGPSAPAGDDDGDGASNAQDNCWLIANAEQANSDGDQAGDACDLCATDPDNDLDNDGLCAEQDACPADFRNDQDRNGVCDTVQCAPYQGVFPNLGTAYGSCPPICSCPPVGFDPIGGYGNLGNLGGSSASGAGGTATGGVTSKAGSTSSGGGASSSAHDSSGATDTSPPSSDAGCACSLKERRASASGWWALAAVVALSRRGNRSRSLQRTRATA